MLAGSPGGNPNGAPVAMIVKSARLWRAKKSRVARSEEPAALEMTGRKGGREVLFLYFLRGRGCSAPLEESCGKIRLQRDVKDRGSSLIFPQATREV